MADDPSSSPPPIQRPLSPHLQIYRWQITMFTSIMHRFTGVVLTAGGILLAAWVIMLAYWPEKMDLVRPYLHHWLAIAVLIGFTFAFFYHLANGIRHLFWDIGKGFTLPVMQRTGMLVIFFSLIATAGTWWAILKQGAE